MPNRLKTGRVRAIPPKGAGRPRGIYAARFAALPVLGFFRADTPEDNDSLRGMSSYWGHRLGRRFTTRLEDGLVAVYREA